MVPIEFRSIWKFFSVENVALGRPATQSGTHTSNTADKAVDGDTDPNLNIDKCAHPDTRTLSDDEHNTAAWWRVDLQASFDIYRVVIHNRLYYEGKSNN